VAFFCVVSVFLFSYIFSWTNDGFVQTKKNAWDGFSLGLPMRTFADDLRKTPVTEWLAQRQREIGWLTIRDTGDQVLKGSDNWFFLADELKIYPSMLENQAQRVKQVGLISELLKRQGVHLVVALLPDKARIEAKHLGGITRPVFELSRYDFLLQTLGRAGVVVVDVKSAMSACVQIPESCYYKTDTHWNYHGADIAARAISFHMLAQGFHAQPKKYNLEIGSQGKNRWGDLIRLSGLDGLPVKLRPNPDQSFDLKLVANPQNRRDVSADDLFGDDLSHRVALVGTSFSRNGYFSESLTYALQAEVGNFAVDGGGFAKSMLAQLTDKQINQAAWVIWEIPERVFTQILNQDDIALEKWINMQQLKH